MNVSFILGDLPPLVIVQNELIDNANLLENNEILCSWIILDVARNGLDLVDKLIDLLELDQKDLIIYDALYQVKELFSLQNI